MAEENAPVKISGNPAAIKKMGEEIEMRVIDSISTLEKGGLVLPENYNYTNAIKFAWLKLQDITDRNGKPALDVCTKASIANSMLEMVLRGETMLQNHGYFIVRGNQLTYDEDYRGKLMRAQRDTNVKDVYPQIIYKGDNFVYHVDEFGRYQFDKHETKMENININNILGGYAIVVYKDGSTRLEVMTIDQIKKSWEMGAAKGNSLAHKGFTDQMCIKTLIKRAIKIELGKASETLSLIGDDSEEEEVNEPEKEQREEANNEIVDIEPVEVVDHETGEVVKQPTRKSSPI